MNIFSENLQITSFYFKEQSPKGFENIYFLHFLLCPQNYKIGF